MEQLLTRLSVATAATAATGGAARGAVTAGAAGSLLLLLPAFPAPPPAGNTGGMASTLIRFLSLLDSGSEDDRRTQFRIDPDCLLCLDGAD